MSTRSGRTEQDRDALAEVIRAVQARMAKDAPAEQLDILCSDPACVSRRWKHSHPEGWPEHPSYKG